MAALNHFETGQVYNGHRLQCRAALTLPDLQKTVRTAIERRLRAPGKIDAARA